MLTSVRIVIRAGRQWSANGDSRLGAALAYYALFSIAPLLVIAINIAGAVYGEDAARGEVKKQLSAYNIDPDSAGALQNLVENAAESHGAASARLLSIGVLLYGALGAFVHLRTSLCLIWKLEPPHTNTVLATLLDYALALVMVLCTGVLVLISVAASVAVNILHDPMDQLFDELFPGYTFPWSWVEFALSVGFLGILFGAIYRVLSGRRMSWGYVAYGAAIAALLFTVGKFALSYYVVYTGTGSAYGAAGSLVVFLVWVYYSSQTLFFGAELIQARRTRGEWLCRPSSVK